MLCCIKKPFSTTRSPITHPSHFFLKNNDFDKFRSKPRTIQVALFCPVLDIKVKQKKVWKNRPKKFLRKSTSLSNSILVVFFWTIRQKFLKIPSLGKLIVFILAVSSLHHAVKTLPQALQDLFKKGIFALPGLSFNLNAVKVRKTAQFQLGHFFRDKKRLVIWHDVVNTLLSRHRSNNNQPLTHPQLIAVLEKYQERIEAKVYCPRERTPDNYNQLKRSTLVTIHIVNDIVSRHD